MRYIKSIDKFLNFFGVEVAPFLPDPNTYPDKVFDRPIIKSPSAVSLKDSDSFPTTSECTRETYIKEKIGFNDAVIWVWKKVR